MDYSQIKRPGVYLDEIALLPPSVVGVSTAVPAFIGYTEFAQKDGTDIRFVPTRINSMIQYQQYFGGAPSRNVEVVLNPLNAVDKVKASTSWYLYDSVQLFFANGGQICYIVPAGLYTDAAASQTNLIKALDALKKYDEPTLVAMPDVMRLSTAVSIGAVQQQAILQCAELQNRFAVLDVFTSNPDLLDLNANDLTEFRDNVGGNLKYAAAYYPWLKTAFQIQVSFVTLTIKKGDSTADLHDLLTDSVQVQRATKIKNNAADWVAAKELLPNSAEYYGNTSVASRKSFIANKITEFLELDGAIIFPHTNTTDSETYTNTQALLTNFQDTTTPTVNGAKLAAIIAAKDALADNSSLPDCDKVFELFVGLINDFIAQIKSRLDTEDKNAKDTIPLYASMIKAAVDKGIVVPPCGAVAGVYAAVDAARGVWKAPANVDIKGVAGPVVRITDEEHMGLNVSPDTGKSINAIRNYTGKGTLVMGARTLAGNDNEWRYINVRRLFIMVETAVKKATEAFIFEPNTITTWLKVKGMIESYLYGLWQNGALAGSKPDQAYFVNVGLGKTMSQDDILNGRMIVDIGMAAVRPAEFIILRFSHKMQEA